MDLEVIREKAWQSMGTRHSHPDREPGYAFFHGQRVAKIAVQLRKLVFPDEEQYDDVLVVGSWFHDVGKGIEPHWEYGALICREILADLCPADKLEKIVEIVGSNTLRKAREYPFYVKLVQDADILDHYGSQEIWLRFWHCAYRRESVDYALQFQRDSYMSHVKKVRALLNFSQSAEFFDEKDQFIRDFMERFAKEAEGELLGK
jgi:uncharacterized protein